MRTLLVTGPGGAGSSTIAAAAAVQAARAGQRTTLVTRRPPSVTGLDAVPDLSVTVVDPQAAIERFWGAHVDALVTVLPQLDLPPETSVAALPGTADVAMLAELGRADADIIVVDAGALEDALSLVGLPAVVRGWLDQLLPSRLRALAAFGGALGGAGAALAAVPALERLLDGSPLAEPSEVRVALTALPRRGTAAVLRRAVPAFALHGLRPAAVLARVLPEGPGNWWAARLAEQTAELAVLCELAPVASVPELAVLPDDLDTVAGLVESIRFPPWGGGASTIDRTAKGWNLAVALPFAERSDVELTRFADDLVLTVAGTRRALRLDPLLRRCTVTGGRLDDAGTAGARLVVSFQPDPRLWPADLLAAHGSPS